jgi:elongation factor 1-alpha
MERKSLNVAFIGHEQSGKSTIVSSLLSASSSYTIPNPHQDFVVIPFISPTSDIEFTLIDTPGKLIYSKNIYTGVSFADVTVLVVDSNDHAFIANIGHHDEVRQYSLAAFAAGAKKTIVCISHMDTHDYNESRYIERTSEVGNYLAKVGYLASNITYIPVSGTEANVTVKDEKNMTWYEGPTLLAALENTTIPDRRRKFPLKVSVLQVFKSSVKNNTVIVAAILSGDVSVGTTLLFTPKPHAGYAYGTVVRIERNHHTINQAFCGDTVGIEISNLLSSDIRRGAVASDIFNPIDRVLSFGCQIVIMRSVYGLKTGSIPIIHSQSQHVPCKVTKLKHLVDKRSGQITEKSPERIKTGQAGLVKVVPTKPIYLDVFNAASGGRYGRLIVTHNASIDAVAVVRKVKVAKDNQDFASILTRARNEQQETVYSFCTSSSFVDIVII